MKNKFKYILILVLLFVVLSIIYIFFINKEETDSDRFSKEYDITENIFVYKDINQIIKILENGTGIVYLGFPECNYCKEYVKILNDTAMEEGVEKIYYFNIKEDRENNTEGYKKIVELLYNNLLSDEDGEKRLFVPDVTFVSNGDIIYHNNESCDTSSNKDLSSYWTEDKVASFKKELVKNIATLSGSICNDDCNK